MTICVFRKENLGMIIAYGAEAKRDYESYKKDKRYEVVVRI